MGYAGAIVAGGVSAALFTIAVAHAGSLLIFLIYLTAIPLFMSGLGAGAVAGLVASAGGTAGLFIVAPSNIGFIYAFIFAVPAIALTAMALRYRIGEDQKIYWYPEGYLLTSIAIYPALLFLGLVVLTSGHPGGLLAITQDALKAVTDEVSKQLGGDEAVLVQSAMDRLAKIAPSVVGCTWMLITMISIYVAQSLLKRQGWNLRPSFVMQGLHVPTWLIYAVAITGLAGVVAPAPFNYIGNNLSILLGIPFFFVGLAVIHAWAATTRAPMTVLVIFYLILSVIVWVGLLVALIGVLDQWMNFRLRLSRPKKPV